MPTRRPSAASRLRREGKREVRVSFAFDATSVIDLVNRQRPANSEELPKDVLPEQRPVLEKYVHVRFTLSNEGKPCAPGKLGGYRYDPSTEKVHGGLSYACPAELTRLLLRSTLFQDEETPHQLIGEFRHQAALERYFFTNNEQLATIDIARLAARSKRRGGAHGGVRIATPPPGAFATPRALSSASPSSSPNAPASTEDAAGPQTQTDAVDTVHTRSSFAVFVQEGLRHIFGGLDHILFVLLLVVAVSSWKELAWVITSFTLAHSITLALGALDALWVSPRLVEPAIALSIVYVAVENFLRPTPKASGPAVTFLFGLLHGLGFGSALRELGLAGWDLAPALLGFNVGVELGQLAIVAPVFPLVLLLEKRAAGPYRRVRQALSVIVGLLAVLWFIERAFDLKLLPF